MLVKATKNGHQSVRTLRPEEYTVGWLCALPASELPAAIHSLDEHHDDPELKLPDTNTYSYGSINRHNVVIACMPPSSPGKVSASGLIPTMRLNFPNIKIYLFVGIGGGVPNKFFDPDPENDIHLGDVVVGWPDKVGAPAVVQYDLGRNREDGFEITSYLDGPEPSLQSALGKLLANRVVGRTRFDDWLQQTAEQNPRFAHPGVAEDKLFKATYPHGQAPDCSNCPSAGYAHRPKRVDTKLIFHQGTIASGDSVMKNALERDRISALCGGARCFEMEAAGVMNQVRPLIIRGISDYADGHKNGKWHNYAAAAAASFAKEFLYTISPVIVGGLEPVKQSDNGQRDTKSSQENHFTGTFSTNGGKMMIGGTYNSGGGSMSF
ncbi:hypothetical protein BP5796_12316 [Coleophoma crateriformis]|uniref:Uncharacterized protein n=1 Tax=Coleophoma crateriformis TaxID=565419 RepID=A0A3D8Q984_9HELO|nr:hypothetical protein BP5796_12316 [Coleophoma crateriformis]